MTCDTCEANSETNFRDTSSLACIPCMYTHADISVLHICVWYSTFIYVYVLSIQSKSDMQVNIMTHIKLSKHTTGSTAFRWLWVFLINGMFLIMFDVLVPIGMCAILFLRSLTLIHKQYSENSHFAYTKLPFLGFLANLKQIRRHMFLAFLLVRAAPPVLPRTF